MALFKILLMEERRESRHVEQIKVSKEKFDQMFDGIWRLSIPKITWLIHLSGELLKLSTIKVIKIYFQTAIMPICCIDKTSFQFEA